jgi:hypothetical protein
LNVTQAQETALGANDRLIGERREATATEMLVANAGIGILYKVAEMSLTDWCD